MSDIPEGHIVIANSELARVLAENAHLHRQVDELQAHCSLKEGQLRAYRRMECSQEQVDKLVKDLEETTARMLKAAGLELNYEIPHPRVVNGAG